MRNATLDKLIASRGMIKISDRNGWAAGTVGIAMGYRATYDNVKVGFVDAEGKYTGEYTMVSRTMVEEVPEEAAKTAPVAAPKWSCEMSEERSPFSTRRATCRGTVLATAGGAFGTRWLCDTHRIPISA
jgi:hypothetical protein